jgi:hypothetical protein
VHPPTTTAFASDNLKHAADPVDSEMYSTVLRVQVHGLFALGG